MINKKLILIGLLLFVLIGCAYYEGVVQPTPMSYLSFFGNIDGAAAVIDDNITLNLDSEKKDSEKKVVLFQVSPGKHKVVVTKMGQEIVNRIIIIGDNATKEIQVP